MDGAGSFEMSVKQLPTTRLRIPTTVIVSATPVRASHLAPQDVVAILCNIKLSFSRIFRNYSEWYDVSRNSLQGKVFQKSLLLL